MFYRTFYRPPIRIKPCFIAIKQWRLEADRRPRFCDGCEETVATDRSSASASFDSSPIDRYPIGRLANLPTIALIIQHHLVVIMFTVQVIPMRKHGQK